MHGIPRSLLLPLRQALLDCDEFYSPTQLRAIFASQELLPWRHGLRSSDSPSEQVDITINYLVGKRRQTSGEYVLVIFLQNLSERYDPEDERHDRLRTLADQLQWFWQCSTKTEAQVKPESQVALEANPSGGQMLWRSELERMLELADSVARVDVPYLRQGEKRLVTGTGWLVAPRLVLTCWHVIQAKSSNSWLEAPITLAELQSQLDNTLFTFDYTAAGKGIQYGVAALEYPAFGEQVLDYAVLRLIDREDFPLSKRSYLRVERHVPLKSQTSLYIIQHPLGQPQQIAGDTFECPSPTDGYILYKTPTESGTSGGPVFNRKNWMVVALHRGENQQAGLREGILIDAILSDLEKHQLDLYQEIVEAQKV